MLKLITLIIAIIASFMPVNVFDGSVTEDKHSAKVYRYTFVKKLGPGEKVPIIVIPTLSNEYLSLEYLKNIK